MPGLKVGDHILPPTITGNPNVLSAYYAEEESRAGYQSTRVYLASEREVAEVFAAMYPDGGWVYRVIPEGELEQDPDVASVGTSWACERALIVEVVQLDPGAVVDILTAILNGEERQLQGLREATQDVRAGGRKGGDQ